MQKNSSNPTSKNGSADLVKKHIQEQSSHRPHWTQIKLSDEIEAMCAVLDHYHKLHCYDRDQLSKRINPGHSKGIHEPEYAGGFDAA